MDQPSHTQYQLVFCLFGLVSGSVGSDLLDSDATGILGIGSELSGSDFFSTGSELSGGSDFCSTGSEVFGIGSELSGSDLFGIGSDL